MAASAAPKIATSQQSCLLPVVDTLWGHNWRSKQIFVGQILHNIRLLLIEMGKDKTGLVMHTTAMLRNSSDVSHLLRLLVLTIDMLFVLDR